MAEHALEELILRAKPALEDFEKVVRVAVGALGNPTNARKVAERSIEDLELARSWRFLLMLYRDAEKKHGVKFEEVLPQLLPQKKEEKMKIEPGIAVIDNMVNPLLLKLARDLVKKGIFPMRMKLVYDMASSDWVPTDIPLLIQPEDIEEVFFFPCVAGSPAVTVPSIEKSWFGIERAIERKGAFEDLCIPTPRYIETLLVEKKGEEIKIRVYNKRVMPLIKKFADELKKKLQKVLGRPIEVVLIKEYV